MSLRLLTYLSPSIPEGLFELVARAVERETGLPASLDFETSVSGPTRATDPFASGRADLAFVCGPSYGELLAAGSPVMLLPAALVFDDPRAQGRPVYFADLIVRHGLAARGFASLRGTAFAYNDRLSLSGWYRMLERLAAIGHSGPPEAFFSRLAHSGSHLESIAAVASGRADGASVDSNALRLAVKRDPDLAGRLTLLEAWGPSPIQPLLARSTLSSELMARVLQALLGMHEDPVFGPCLADFGVLRFSPADETVYARLSVPT